MADRMIVDASVAAKWFLKDKSEADVELAESLLLAFLAGEVELYAPQIFPYEVCGLLARACGGGTPRLAKDKSIQCAQEFFRLPIEIDEGSEEEKLGALEMAIDFSKQYYDMTYIWLSEKLNCRWCTADDKVQEAVTSSFPSHRVVPLSNLMIP